jgi:CRISPR-associated exonuclease Cas4
MEAQIIATDLKQWAYCPRIVYYRWYMPGIGQPSFKMEEAQKAQDLIERLEIRRSLKAYGFDDAERRVGLWLNDEELGLAGKFDVLLVAEAEVAVVDFKLTSGEPSENHRLQLAGYSLIAERRMRRPARRAFLYRIPDDRVFSIPIDAQLRERVVRALEAMRSILGQERLPQATVVRARCRDCEYQNYCADIW